MMHLETNLGDSVHSDLAMIRNILRKGCDEMPKRYQDPKLEKREDVANPYWFIRVRLKKGEPRRPLKLGFCNEMNQKAAMKERGDVLRGVNSGLLVAQSRLKFKEVVAQYRASRVPRLGAAAKARYTSIINCHILPAFGDRQMVDIDMGLVEAWLASKSEMSWHSRHSLRGVLSAIFSAAKDWKYWSGENPAFRVPIGRKKEARELSKKPPLTADQLKSILAAVGEDARLMILLAALLDLRVSEVLGLQWGDIDFEAGALMVNRRWYRGDLDDPKNDPSKRRKELGPLVDELKQRYPGPHKRQQFVFVGDDGKDPPDDRDILRFEIRPKLRKLELYYPGFGYHQFRRNSITWRQTVGGATAIEASKGAGQTRMATTMHYTLVDGNRDKEQVTRMYDWLMGPVGGPKQ